MSALPSTDGPTGSSPGRFTVTAARYRIVAGCALALICIIVLTGAAVRLTGSGLGCDTWPNCSSDELVQFGTPNQAIEQANRLFTGLVSIAVVAAVLGSLRRVPYRRDLVILSWGLVAGVVGQIVLGGITVLVHLHPIAVSSHFVLSMLLVADATVLFWRSGRPAGPRTPQVPRTELGLSRAAVACAALLMVTGPVVTGSGPHAGDGQARRFSFFIPDVVRLHSLNMWLFLIVVVVLMFRLARGTAAGSVPAAVMRRAQWLLAAIVVQGAIGYTQYELGIPAWLVSLHIVGATAVLVLAIWSHLGTSTTIAATAATAEHTGGATGGGRSPDDGSRHEAPA